MKRAALIGGLAVVTFVAVLATLGRPVRTPPTIDVVAAGIQGAPLRAEPTVNGNAMAEPTGEATPAATTAQPANGEADTDYQELTRQAVDNARRPRPGAAADSAPPPAPPSSPAVLREARSRQAEAADRNAPASGIPADARRKHPVLRSDPAKTKQLEERMAVKPASPEAAAPAAEADGYQALTFQQLSNYDYEMPDPEERRTRLPNAPKIEEDNQIPAEVLALSGKRIRVQGFMVPIIVEEGRVKRFILTGNQLLCCFGVSPWLNEWISVTLADAQGAEYTKDVVVTVYGTLDVGEEIKDGWVLSLYRLKADKLVYRSGF